MHCGMVFVAGRRGSSCCLAGRSAVVEPRFANGRLNCVGTKRRPAFFGKKKPAVLGCKADNLQTECGATLGAGACVFACVGLCGVFTVGFGAFCWRSELS